jgi:hypothetical protein
MNGADVMSGEKKITVDDFLRMFDCKLDALPERFIKEISQINTKYREANLQEFEEYVLYVLNLINSPGITRTSEENLEAFEKGWQENLESIASGKIQLESLKPKYFRPSKFLRYDNKLIVSDNLNLEYELFILARYLLFSRYLSQFEDIYEFGCGSCQNLVILSEIFPEKRLYGLDWTKTSRGIAGMLAEAKNLNIEGIVFDMMNPSPDVVLKPHSAVFTIHSLEQLGEQHQEFLSFLMAAEPGIVFHYEPILEFYKPDNLLDYLAILYSQKRNYLSGFWTALCKLREENKIEIIESRRPLLGGIIHEASLIAWRPL